MYIVPNIQTDKIDRRQHHLYVVLSAFFIANVLLAEFIGVKIFSLEAVLGLEPMNWGILGIDGLGFNLTAGVLLWPVVFVMTDIINEYFGQSGVRRLTYLAIVLIVYAFIMIYVAIGLPPASFWPSSHLLSLEGAARETMVNNVGDYNIAYRLVLGQGLWIIIGSIIAFLVGQIVDVVTFHRIKRVTGEKKLWLRATGSTLISQLIDSFVVLFIAFYIGGHWPLVQVLAIGVVNYCYKFIVAIILTPLIYAAHHLIDAYLGEELSSSLRADAAK